MVDIADNNLERIKAYIKHLEGNYLTPVGKAQDTIFADLKWAITEIERLEAELSKVVAYFDGGGGQAKYQELEAHNAQLQEEVEVRKQTHRKDFDRILQLRAALERVQWGDIDSVSGNRTYCIECRYNMTQGHRTNCSVGLALKGAS